VLQSAIVLNVPLGSLTHIPVVPVQLCIGLHDAVQLAFVCVPVGTWEHFSVIGSVHA
jgi:hypothetical protein